MLYNNVLIFEKKLGNSKIDTEKEKRYNVLRDIMQMIFV